MPQWYLIQMRRSEKYRCEFAATGCKKYLDAFLLAAFFNSANGD